jgi:hypothetical protein
MQIEISTDSNIEGREELATHVKGVVESALNRFSDRITRVEVHLSDVNSDKGGEDGIRCVMEARLEGAPAHRRHAPGNDLGPSGRRCGR